ncbi:hypothetical protein Tco_1020587 [Tanacetum coccineum]
MDQEPNPSDSGTQEQLDEFDAWMEGFETCDDEVPTEEVSPELMKEISEEIDEAQLKKAVDDMLRQRCNSGEEHQYHVDQMQKYLKNDIVWESRKERLSLPTLQKPTPFYHSCQRDLKAPPMTMMNQDMFYLKYGNSGPKKYTLSLHKYPAVPFPDDDIEERTSRWVSKRLIKFNVYAQYGVEHWKNIWAKQFHIKMKKEKRDKPKEVYSDSKIVKVIRTSYELGHEHKFITELIVRIANGKIDPITEPDYKYLNKNEIEDLYLLCINGKVDNYRETGLLGSLTVFIRSTVIWERVHDFQLGMESYHQKVNLTAPTITFPGIKDHELFTITSKPVVGMIYENSKKEKRVMIHNEIYKFCDATLKRVMEKLKKYNKDVKYRYVDPSLSDADDEYLRFYEEDIEDRLKH